MKNERPDYPSLQRRIGGDDRHPSDLNPFLCHAGFARGRAILVGPDACYDPASGTARPQGLSQGLSQGPSQGLSQACYGCYPLERWDDVG